MKSLHKRWDNMDNDVGRRPGRHLQETKKLQIQDKSQYTDHPTCQSPAITGDRGIS